MDAVLDGAVDDGLLDGEFDGAGGDGVAGGAGSAGDAGGADDTAGGGAEGDSAGAGADGTEGDGSELSGSKLWNAVKGKTKDWSTADRLAMRKAIFAADEAGKLHPDGLSQVTKTLEMVRELSDDPNAAPEAVIAATLQERGYFRELDQAFTKADPAFANKLADADPIAFQKQMPAFLQEYSRLNPEGYAAMVSQAVMADYSQSEVPLQWSILRTFLPQLADGPAKDRVLEALEKIFGWTNRLQAMSKAPIEAKGEQKNAAGGDLAGREESLAQRELTATRVSWNAELRSFGDNMVASEAAKNAGKQKLSDREMQTVRAAVKDEVNVRCAADKKYGQKMGEHLKNGNKAAYSKLNSDKLKAVLPAAVKRAVQDVIAKRPKGGAKGAAGGHGGNGSQQQQNGQQRTATRINGHPSTMGMQVDHLKTTREMLLANKAYLKGKSGLFTWPSARPKS